MGSEEVLCACILCGLCLIRHCLRVCHFTPVFCHEQWDNASADGALLLLSFIR